MDKNLVVRFLAKEAIKAQGNGKANDRLWNAIRKAHRDVITGARTGNIPYYVDINKDGKNASLKCLYRIISDSTGPLYSASLIDQLQNDDEKVEFSAVQKLVNMTLKYLIIINDCEDNQVKFEICEDKCDCPIDSVILEKLKKVTSNKHTCWTAMHKDEYNQVQSEIAAYLQKEYPGETYGNIWFDFLMW